MKVSYDSNDKINQHRSHQIGFLSNKSIIIEWLSQYSNARSDPIEWIYHLSNIFDLFQKTSYWNIKESLSHDLGLRVKQRSLATRTYPHHRKCFSFQSHLCSKYPYFFPSTSLSQIADCFHSDSLVECQFTQSISLLPHPLREAILLYSKITPSLAILQIESVQLVYNYTKTCQFSSTFCQESLNLLFKYSPWLISRQNTSHSTKFITIYKSIYPHLDFLISLLIRALTIGCYSVCFVPGREDDRPSMAIYLFQLLIHILYLSKLNHALLYVITIDIMIKNELVSFLLKIFSHELKKSKPFQFHSSLVLLHKLIKRNRKALEICKQVKAWIILEEIFDRFPSCIILSLLQDMSEILPGKWIRDNESIIRQIVNIYPDSELGSFLVPRGSFVSNNNIVNSKLEFLYNPDMIRSSLVPLFVSQLDNTLIKATI